MPPRPAGKRLTEKQRSDLVKQAVHLHQNLGLTQREIAAKLDVSQPTVCIWLHAAIHGKVTITQKRIASRLRDEMVCCDIYQRFMDLADAAKQHELKAGPDWHDVCFYGEWAARIAMEPR